MNLFTYGTLMAPDIMKEVSGCMLVSVECTLSGYRRYTVRGEQYPGMIRESGGEVRGMLYLDVPPEAIARLDLFEGAMYSREPVTVRHLKSFQPEEAMTYVIKPEYEYMLTHAAWDYEDFLENGKRLFEERYCGFAAIEKS